MKNKFFIVGIMFLISCTNAKKVDEPVKNIYPIDFKSNKVLEFYTETSEKLLSKDTFQIYTLTNTSSDTIWIRTIMDSTLKDHSIKTIFNNHIRYKKNKDRWYISTSSNSNGYYDKDSIKLCPSQATFFAMGKISLNDYDSMSYDISVKIKKGFLVKDTVVTKKFILHNNENFIEDLNDWSKVINNK